MMSPLTTRRTVHVVLFLLLGLASLKTMALASPHRDGFIEKPNWLHDNDEQMSIWQNSQIVKDFQERDLSMEDFLLALLVHCDNINQRRSIAEVLQRDVLRYSDHQCLPLTNDEIHDGGRHLVEKLAQKARVKMIVEIKGAAGRKYGADRLRHDLNSCDAQTALWEEPHPDDMRTLKLWNALTVNEPVKKEHVSWGQFLFDTALHSEDTNYDDIKLLKPSAFHCAGSEPHQVCAVSCGFYNVSKPYQGMMISDEPPPSQEVCSSCRSELIWAAKKRAECLLEAISHDAALDGCDGCWYSVDIAHQSDEPFMMVFTCYNERREQKPRLEVFEDHPDDWHPDEKKLRWIY